ncbi:MAG: hypothetical protein IPL90_15140 [Holophagales bacterium]|nr:hypothetical protein [Holophagales bacterium]
MRPFAASMTILSGLLASALPAHAVRAENLLVNGDFRENTSSWSRLDLVSYSAGGAASPGSARITLPNRPEGSDAMLQCVAVEGYRLYDLSAAARLPEWPGHSGGVSLRLQWHADPGCQGPTLRGAPSLDFSYTEPAGWQVKERRRIPAPQAAVSALVVVIARSAGEEPYPIFVDDVVLRRSVEDEDFFIPTAASVRGAKGERFETDLWVHNPAPAERMFTLRSGATAARRPPSSFTSARSRRGTSPTSSRRCSVSATPRAPSSSPTTSEAGRCSSPRASSR